MNQKVLKAHRAKLSVEQGRRVSLEETEADIVRVLTKIAYGLAPIYVFGYHALEDIQQEGILYGLEALETGNYDVARPLENFLYAHTRNRLYNNKRNNYMRPEPPCECCDPATPPCFPCTKFVAWQKRNAVKQNLMRPMDVSVVSVDGEASMMKACHAFEEAIGRELRLAIDSGLPVDLRADYLKMMSGLPVSKSRKTKVREAVLRVAKQQGWLDDEETEA